MEESNSISPEAAVRNRRRLRIIGILVLALGLSSAGLVYWLGTRAAAWRENPALADYSSAQSRQMAVMYGKMGLLIDDMVNALNQPDTQAVLIAASSGVVGLGCLYLSRRPEDEKPTNV